MNVRISRTGIASLVAALFLAACSGGAHSTVPATTSGAPAQPGAIAHNGNFALSVRITAPAGTLATLSSARTPQYISGRTSGIYVHYACTGTCTGAPSPTAAGAVYADVSPTSPLCGGAPGAPVTAPYTCAIGLTLQGGYTYALLGVAVNQAPLGSINGYGTGFCTGGGTVFGTGTCTGSGATELSIVTGNVPILTGSVNSLNGGLNPIAQQFASVVLTSGTNTWSANDGLRTVTAYGETTVDLTFETGDAAGNLIVATPGCFGSGCENFADPFGGNSSAPVLNTGTGPSLTTGSPYFSNEDDIHVSSNTSTAFGVFDYAADLWPASCSSCFSGSAGNASSILFQNAIPAPGIMDASYIWDGTPAADNPPGCSGQACYAVPMLVNLNNEVPCTSGSPGCNWGSTSFSPVVYNASEPCTSSNCTYASGYSFYVAPFEVVLSCGSNATCGTSFSQGTNVANAASGGTVTLDAYDYHSGFTTGGYGSPCYPSGGALATSTSIAHSCMSIASNGESLPTGSTLGACYTSGNCEVAQSSTPGLWYCYPPNFPISGTSSGAVASIQFNEFVEGKQANQFQAGGNLGVADWADFTISLLSSTGTCSFEVQNGRGTVKPSAMITISPSGSGSTPINVTIPTPSPIL